MSLFNLPGQKCCHAAAPPLRCCSRLGFQFFLFWATEVGKENKGWVFFISPGQISAFSQHVGCKPALQTTTTFFGQCRVLFLIKVGFTVTLGWERISRRGDLRKSATEQNDANEERVATLEISTAEQLPRLCDAPFLLIQTWTVTPSLYIFWEAVGTEVNLTGQPPSLYPGQTDRHKRRHTWFLYVAPEMTVGTTV